MKILLDTHVLLWWLTDSDRLGKTARELVADPANDILVSMVSFWEIAQSHYRTLMTVPVRHRDPFDHLLIAQAIAEKAVFLSENGHVSAYPVQAIRCSSTA